MPKFSYDTVLNSVEDSCALTQPLVSPRPDIVPQTRPTPTQTQETTEAPPTQVSGSAQQLQDVAVVGNQLTGNVTIDLTPFQQALSALNFSESKDGDIASTITSTKVKPSLDSQLGIDATGNTTFPNNVAGSLIVNSDRVVINSKQQLSMLLGQKGVAVASPGKVNIDAGDSITLAAYGADGGLFIGVPNRGVQYTTNRQAQIGLSKGSPTADQPYEPLVLGIKLANLLEDFLFILKSAEGVDALSPVKFQPNVQAEFALLANRIPEILSNYAYVDGMSHGTVDMEQLRAIESARASTPDYAPPPSLTGSFQGSFTMDPSMSNLTGTDTGPITGEQKIQNIKTIAQYLKSIGLTKEGAIGLIGNILGESGANPSAIEKKTQPILGGTGGIGIVQWTASRRRKLEAAANNDTSKITNLNFQLQYLGGELQKSYSGVLNKLRTSRSVEESTIYVLEKFEVPGTYLNRATNPDAYKATQQKRIGYANSAASIVNGVYA